jgi:ubiquinone biosynthesis O-methyltransferase
LIKRKINTSKMEFERIADIKRLGFIIGALKEKLPDGAEVLDVGCGNGVISRSLGEQGFHVKGIDISNKTIEKAISLNKLPNVRFEVISAEQLVANGQRYHAVICSEVLEHLNDPGMLLKVLYQSLHEDGILIVTVPNGRGPRESFVTKPIIALKKKNNWVWRSVKGIKSFLGYKGTTAQTDADDLTHVQFFTKTTLEQLATNNNFRIIRFGKTNFIEDVFPFSFLAKRIKLLQKWDCAFAERLPYRFTGGFVTVWEKDGK